MTRAALWLLSVTACGGNECPREDEQIDFTGSRPRVLLVTHSAGWRHDSLDAAANAILELGKQEGAYDLHCSDDARVSLTAEKLPRYQAVAFFTSGELGLSDEQKAAFLAVLRGGIGFVGIHSATDTYYGWPEYGDVVGARFERHPWNQEVAVQVTSSTHQVVRGLPQSFRIADEIYQFGAFLPGNEVMLELDPVTVDMRAAGVERRPWRHPLAWTRSYGRGRVFYTALGHRPEVWTAEAFRTLLRNGILWSIDR